MSNDQFLVVFDKPNLIERKNDIPLVLATRQVMTLYEAKRFKKEMEQHHNNVYIVHCAFPLKIERK